MDPFPIGCVNQGSASCSTGRDAVDKTQKKSVLMREIGLKSGFPFARQFISTLFVQGAVQGCDED